MVATRTKKLGQILVDSGQISEDQLEQALREQKQTGEKLGSILQRLGICTEKDIARVLAGQAGVSFVSLAQEWIQREALELIPGAFAQEHQVVPLSLRGKTLILAMANPLDLDAIDAVSRMTGRYVEVVHATEGEVHEALVRYYDATSDLDAVLQDSITEAREAVERGANLGEADSPFIRLVDLLLRKAVEDGATDIHLEPEEKVLRSRYRVDGRLVQGPFLAKDLQSIVTTRLKILAGMNISETRLPQDGRILYDVGKRKVDLRVSTFPTVHGETVVCRVLDKQNLLVGLDKLGMSKPILTQFRQDIARPHGIVLVTGPTGSGKTTTLYSALAHLNKPDTKIITLEDPVEYELPSINQAPIHPAQGFTFAAGLRAVLRQDPDILLVGEIRDQETAEMAIRAALTGHLVFSTLHTNSAVGAIPRLVDMGIERFLLSATLIAVLAQRLVRKVCPLCRVRQEPDEEQLALLQAHGIDVVGRPCSTGRGCPACRQTGYSGRGAVFEYLRIDADVRALIAAGAGEDEIEKAAVAVGMRTLREDTFDKVLAGTTSLSELMRVVA
jgi:type IV pilus assembly protein PilB